MTILLSVVDSLPIVSVMLAVVGMSLKLAFHSRHQERMGIDVG